MWGILGENGGPSKVNAAELEALAEECDKWNLREEGLWFAVDEDQDGGVFVEE